MLEAKAATSRLRSRMTASSWWIDSRHSTADQCRHRRVDAAADPLSHHHTFPSRPHRRQQGVRQGGAIVAHENVKTHRDRTQRSHRNKVPPPGDALPTETYKDTMTVRLQGRAAELKHPWTRTPTA